MLVAVLLENFLTELDSVDVEQQFDKSALGHLDPLLETLLLNFNTYSDLQRRIHGLFKTLDADGSGQLDYFELRAGMRKLPIDRPVIVTPADWVLFSAHLKPQVHTAHFREGFDALLARSSGLQWEESFTVPSQAWPEWELSNPALATALASGKTTFSSAEWSQFHISIVRMCNFIQAGAVYFKPAWASAIKGPSSGGMVRQMSPGSSRSRAETAFPSSPSGTSIIPICSSPEQSDGLCSSPEGGPST